jgi:putative phosphoesterase
MSLAVLCDIHGNLPALDAVLAELDAETPDAVVIGGDVAAGPQPNEVLARLRALPWPVHWLRGNADRLLLDVLDGRLSDEQRAHPIFVADAWTVARMARADVELLHGLPRTLRLGDVLFCHGTPASDEERLTTATPDQRLAAVLEQAGASFVVGGHTHRQYDRTAGGRRMINAGSVGRPYEHRPGAYWLRLGPDVDLRRTDYDTRAATDAFRVLGYPSADGMLAPPADPDALAERFEAAAATPVSDASRAP